jgi:hypothetical protein
MKNATNQEKQTGSKKENRQMLGPIKIEFPTNRPIEFDQNYI